MISIIKMIVGVLNKQKNGESARPKLQFTKVRGSMGWWGIER
jgi:hypothetical protein